MFPLKNRKRLSVTFYATIHIVLASVAAFAAPTSIRVIADNNFRPHTSGQIEIPSSVREIRFRIGDPPFGNNKDSRLVRHKLEGVDDDWVARPGLMRFSVQFYNEAGDQISQETFAAEGKSAGWRGTIEASTFTHRRESLFVPKGASRIFISISSAGPPSSMGIYVVEGIVVKAIGADGSSEIVMESAPFLRGEAEGKKDAEWIADGEHPTMATIARLGNSASSAKAFCIIDTDPLSHAEWHYARERAPEVKPGEQLIIEWNELFYNGLGDMFEAAYATPQPGRYVFRTQELDVFGNAVKGGEYLNVSIPVPYWKSPVFLATCAVGGAALLGAGGIYFFRAAVRRRVSRFEQETLLARERLRIARDIHDDLGTRLTHISLISSIASKEDEFPKPAVDEFNKISNLTRDMVSALYETVWTVNPTQDHLESLVTFLRQTIQNLCASAGIRCRLERTPVPEDYPVRSELRHNISLITKEAINNAIKHSGASEIRSGIKFSSNILTVSIEDNGRGFSTPQKSEAGSSLGGSGLENMHKRIMSINGQLTIDSDSGKGTRVVFEIPIPKYGT